MSEREVQESGISLKRYKNSNRSGISFDRGRNARCLVWASEHPASRGPSRSDLLGPVPDLGRACSVCSCPVDARPMLAVGVATTTRDAPAAAFVRPRRVAAARAADGAPGKRTAPRRRRPKRKKTPGASCCCAQRRTTGAGCGPARGSTTTTRSSRRRARAGTVPGRTPSTRPAIRGHGGPRRPGRRGRSSCRGGRADPSPGSGPRTSACEARPARADVRRGPKRRRSARRQADRRRHPRRTAPAGPAR